MFQLNDSLVDNILVGHVKLMNIQADLQIPQAEMNRVVSFYSLALVSE